MNVLILLCLQISHVVQLYLVVVTCGHSEEVLAQIMVFKQIHLQVLISGSDLVCANCGDSKAILSRMGTPEPLSIDHKPHEPSETARIKAAGGNVRYLWIVVKSLGRCAKDRHSRFAHDWVVRCTMDRNARCVMG